MDEILRRGIEWHRGKLPVSEFLRSYLAHIDGPDAATQLRQVYPHTYACLDPEYDIYTAFNTGEWPGLGIRADELRQLVISAVISKGDVSHQQQVAHSSDLSLDRQWEVGRYMARTLLLPVGMYVIGHTADTNERVVDLMVPLAAPLEKVAATFKVATPKIRFK